MSENTIPFSKWLRNKMLPGQTGDSFANIEPRISRASVYHYLKGVRQPNPAAIEKIAQKLQIAITDIPEEYRSKK